MDPSYTAHIIVALIRAQGAMETSWCDSYTYANEVRIDESLTMDMRPAASRLIFEYMDLYAEYCDYEGGEEGDEYEEGYIEEYYSPLTSTPFATYYEEEPLVAEAIMSTDALTEDMIVFLADEKRPIEQKMALINGLSYRIEGSSNGEAYLQYILQKGGFTSVDDFKNRGKVRDLICVAYLKAMDNVYDVTDAMDFVYTIRSKQANGYTVNLICALIEAQQYLNGDNWCLIYNATNYVREDATLRMDMKVEAAEVIFTYMDMYKEYCGEIAPVEYEEGGE